MFNPVRFFKSAVAAAAFAAGSTAAMAETKDLSIAVFAEIPTATFYVTASPTWNASEIQSFGYSNGALQPMSRSLEIKSTIGAVRAYLLTTAELLGAANKKIGIDVVINGKTLNVGSSQTVEVLDKATAATGKRVSVTLTPSTATSTPGTYNGQVAMVFDSTI
jgi:fructose-specific component phosphotransferase system IIB-like protein